MTTGGGRELPPAPPLPQLSVSERRGCRGGNTAPLPGTALLPPTAGVCPEQGEKHPPAGSGFHIPADQVGLGSQQPNPFPSHPPPKGMRGMEGGTHCPSNSPSFGLPDMVEKAPTGGLFNPCRQSWVGIALTPLLPQPSASERCWRWRGTAYGNALPHMMPSALALPAKVAGSGEKASTREAFLTLFPSAAPAWLGSLQPHSFPSHLLPRGVGGQVVGTRHHPPCTSPHPS